VSELSRQRTADSGEWQPSLLRVPRGVRAAVDSWVPTLVPGRRVTTAGLIVLFLVLQFLIPARLVLRGMGAEGRPSVAVGILLAFLWGLSSIRTGRLPSGRQPIRWVIALYVILQLVGYAVGFDRLPSAVEARSADRWMIFTVSIAGVTLAVADGLRTRLELDRVLRVLVGLASVMSFVGVLQFLRIIDLTRFISLPGMQQNSDLIGVSARGDEMFARVAGTANHYIEFGVVLATVLPIALHYALFSPPGRVGFWRWLGVAMVGAGIPLSISRAAVLATVVAFGLMFVVWPWRQRYNALVMGVLAVGAYHVVNRGVLGTIKALFLNADQDTSVTDRIARTDYVVDLWQLRPWLGRGAGMVIPSEYILLDNQWYMTLLAGGVVGVVGLLVFFLAPYFVARSIRLRGHDQETRHLAQALAVAMPTAIIVSGTFDSLSFSTWVGTMCVIIGAVGALWRLEGMSPRRPLRRADAGDKYVSTPLLADLRDRDRLRPEVDSARTAL
jgi:hypothetical protein